MCRQRFFLIPLCLSMIFVACGKKDIHQRDQKIAVLETRLAEKDTMISVFFRAFNQFEANLSEIKDRENLITFEVKNARETRFDPHQRITEDIETIQGLLDENRSIIQSLEYDIHVLGNENFNFKLALERLNSRLGERDKKLKMLVWELRNKDTQLRKLSQEKNTLISEKADLAARNEEQNSQLSFQQKKIDVQESYISSQEEAAQTVWFILGDKKKLRAYDILSTGKKLRQGFSDAAFSEMNMFNTRFLPIPNARTVELLTQHPDISFRLHKKGRNVQGLEILDPENFWKISKHLVILTN